GLVEIKLRKGARFLDIESPEGQALWQAWKAKPENLAKKNRFPEAQTKRMKSSYFEIPNHSAFYDEYRLAGVASYKDTEDRRVLNSLSIANFRMVDWVHGEFPVAPPLLLAREDCDTSLALLAKPLDWERYVR